MAVRSCAVTVGILLFTALSTFFQASVAVKELKSSNGRLSVTLDVQVARVYLPFRNISFMARTYNGSVPGPRLRVSPGDRVEIRLVNSLGPNPHGSGCHSPMARYRAANATNLHVHGIFANAHDDNTFKCIHPGREATYIYDVNSQSTTSTLWYHPHLDGSSAAQLYGGMAGAFEIENTEQDSIFDFALDVPLVVQMMDLDPKSKQFLGAYVDMKGASKVPLGLHNPSGFVGKVLLTNGLVGLSQRLEVGRLARFKVINAMGGANNNLHFGFLGASAAECDLYVLAYDGVYLDMPRAQRSVFLPSGGRCDVAVTCRTAGRHTLATLTEGVGAFGGMFDDKPHAMVSLEVVASPAVPATLPGSSNSSVNLRSHLPKVADEATRLPARLPGRPPYYPDCLGAKHVERHSILFSNTKGGNVVAGWPYNGSVSHMATTGSMQEWLIMAGEGKGLKKLHPYHQHMVHFQVVSASVDTSGLVVKAGDWRDTVPMYKDLNYTIRFRNPFEGPMMVHCHILKHEDMGMMTLVNFTRPSWGSGALGLAAVASRGTVAGAAALGLVALGALGFGLWAGRLACRAMRRCDCASNYARLP